MPTPPLADGADLSAPDGANRFRQQLIADVDDLLREHHSRMMQQVEETMEELCARVGRQPASKTSINMPDALRGKLQKLIPHHGSRNSSRSTVGRESVGLLRKEEVLQRKRNSDGSSGLAKEAARTTQVAAARERSPGRTTNSPGPALAEEDVFRSTGVWWNCQTRTSTNEEEDVVAELSRDDAPVEPKAPPAPRESRMSRTSAWLNNKVQCLRSYSDDMKEKWLRALNKSMVLSTMHEDVEEFDSSEDVEVKRMSAIAPKRVRTRLRRIVASGAFESITCVLIITNAAFFGIETQFMSMGITPGVFNYITNLYTGVFTCELIMRIGAEGKDFFCTSQWVWNIVDACVVFVSLLETAFQASNAGGSTNLTYIRVIRVARIVRIFRVVRVFQAFSSLRILLHCVLNTLRSLVWTMVLLTGILYVFGVLFTQAAWEVLGKGRGQWTEVQDQENYDALKRYFGGLQWAIFTQFKAVTGGVSWQEVSAPLGFVHPFWEFLFTVFISFTYFAVLNVVTGVFCQSAIESAANDKDMVVQAQLANKRLYTDQLRELFEKIDSSHSGRVDFFMLQSCLGDPQCQAYFEVLGITSDDAWNLFKLLDDDDSNRIELEEFVSGCLRLRGCARSIDSHMMLYESRWTMRKVGCLLEAFNELLAHLSTLGTDEDGTLVGGQKMLAGEKPPLPEERPHSVVLRDNAREPQQEASSCVSTTDSPGSGQQKELHSAGSHGEPADSRRSPRVDEGALEDDARSAEPIGDLTSCSIAKL